MALSDDIRIERRGHAGIITLTRGYALNALTRDMLLAIEAAIGEWGADDRVAHAVIRAEGRAFSAGGDLKALYDARGDGLSMLPFFADEYRINAALRAWTKPCVALIDGIVMGGGVGASFHGSHRVMGENAVFAMPETGIGFFPDVGGSYLLSRVPGNLGRWLGLTGARIRRGDALALGLATHCAPGAAFESIVEELAASADTDSAISRHAVPCPPETDDAARAVLDAIFAGDTVAAIAAEAERRAQTSEAAANAARQLGRASPTSLAVALRQIGEGARLDMAGCMMMEYRIVARMLTGHDFFEGIRTVLIDKGAAPQWTPSRIADVDPEEIDRYFAPMADLGEGELEL